MAILFFAGFAVAYWAESAAAIRSSIAWALRARIWRARSAGSAPRASALFATVTTDTSCGAVNSMHDSFMPLGGLVPLVNMQLGEIVFGGVGSGLYGMIVFVVLTVFIAGLMVGRTPEYLGKKIERREVQFAILAVLVTPVLCLVPTAIAAVTPAGSGHAEQRRTARLLRNSVCVYVRPTPTTDPHSPGLGPNLFYNISTGINMVVRPLCRGDPGAGAGRALWPERRPVAEGVGTFTTHSPIFVALLIGDDRDRRRADVLAGRRARTDRRTLARPARKDVLR